MMTQEARGGPRSKWGVVRERMVGGWGVLLASWVAVKSRV